MRIPKIIHRIWLGGQEMPGDYVRFGETWREHHPDWEMRLWTDNDLPPLTRPESYERCRNFGEASDVLRYEILTRFGGVYVDTDVECLRSLEPLIENADAFAAYARPGLIGSAVLGAVPNHPAFARTLEVVCDGAGSGSQVVTTGPVALTRVLEEAGNIELFGRDTFYPLDYWEIPLADADGGADLAGAYAIHHWHATWQSRDNMMRRMRALMQRTRTHKQRRRRLRKQNRLLERKIERRDKRLHAARERERALARRLERIESSRWWRLGVRLGRAKQAIVPGRRR